MNFETYTLITVSFVLNWIVGFTISKNKILSLPIGCFFLGTIIALLMRFIPGYTLSIIKIICAFSVIILIVNKNYRQKLKFNLKEIFNFSLILIFFLLFFINFQYRFNIYETHEVLYYSPSIELSLSDYIGNIKTLTYYPSQLTGHPNYPSAVMSALMILVNDINLIKLIETRYLVLSIFFSLIFIFFVNYNRSYNKYFLFFLYIIPLYFFEYLIGHSLLYSGIFGIIIMYFLLIIICFEEKDCASIKLASYLSVFLCMTKPGVAFIFWVFPIFYYLKFKFIRKDPLFYIFGTLVFLNYITWVLLPVTIGNAYFSLFNPLKYTDYFYTFLASEWFKNSLLFEIINNYFDTSQDFKIIGEPALMNKLTFVKINATKIFINIIKFLNVFLITFFLSWLLIKKVNIFNKKILNYFLLISLIIFIFVRNENIYENKTVEQTVHVFHYVAVIAALLLPIYLKDNFFDKKNLFLILLFILNAHFKILYGSNEMNLRIIKGNSYVIYQDFKNRIQNTKKTSTYILEDYIISKKQILTKEIEASMLGLRILRSENDKFKDDRLRPYMIQWSYPRLHEFYWFSENKIHTEMNKKDNLIDLLIENIKKYLKNRKSYLFFAN
jgi:hypothetical protein